MKVSINMFGNHKKKNNNKPLCKHCDGTGIEWEENVLYGDTSSSCFNCEGSGQANPDPSNGWKHLKEWDEELHGDVAIIIFNSKGEIYTTLWSSPLCSDFPELEGEGLHGYFKCIDTKGIPEFEVKKK